MLLKSSFVFPPPTIILNTPCAVVATLEWVSKYTTLPFAEPSTIAILREMKSSLITLSSASLATP